MNVMDAINARRSIRKFEDKPVEKEKNRASFKSSYAGSFRHK